MPQVDAQPVPRIVARADVRVQSFEAFYGEHRDRIARSLALTLHDGDLAAECADEAMLRAYSRWNRVWQLDNPAGWVYRVGLNCARSTLRRRSGPVRVLFDRDDDMLVEPADRELRDALVALDLDRRAVVVCRFYLGMSVEDTAVALRVRPGTVKSRLHRALRDLESALGPRDQEMDR
jgi:RNA polymerase sigma factor (sigma-70 family)